MTIDKLAHSVWKEIRQHTMFTDSTWGIMVERIVEIAKKEKLPLNYIYRATVLCISRLTRFLEHFKNWKNDPSNQSLIDGFHEVLNKPVTWKRDWIEQFPDSSA